MEELEALVFDELKENMEKIIHAFEKSLQKVRTGRASLSLLDGIRVDYYGVPTPLNQLATLSVPESRLIVIAPWDASVIGGVERAILKSDLGLNPMNDGKLIRIAIPALTEERRRELVKVVKKMAEECKIKLRNARRDGNEQLKSLKKDNEISEDDLYADQKEVQETTDRHIEQTDAILAAKELEIMEI
jgi:ribosome recycling factor